MDPALPKADTVLIQDGKISKVGYRGEPGLDPKQGDRVFDLHGGVVLPGFMDAHMHFTQMVWEASLLDLSGARGEGDLRDLVAAGLETGGEWLIGRKLSGTLLESARSRGGSLLCGLAAQRPVILGTEDMHSALVNSKGIEFLESADILPGLPARLVEKIDDLFLLKEEASSAAWRWIEKREKNVTDRALEDGVSLLHSKGVTGIYTFERPVDRRLIEANRACMSGLMMTAGCYDEDLEDVLSRKSAMGMVRGGVKIFLDGALGSRTALLLEPYEDAPGCGIESTSHDRRTETAITAARGGTDLCLHAIGDRAVRLALDLLTEVSEEYDREDSRDRIEHIQLLHTHDLGRFLETGAVASIQPAHLVADRRMAETAWGDRCRRAYPMNSLYEAGARVVYGSDAPFSPVDPLMAIKVAVTRKAPGCGQHEIEWSTGECVSVDDAFASQTSEAAYSARLEDQTGMIREGLHADIVVLSGNPFLSEADLLKTEITATIAGGEVVYGGEKLATTVHC